MPGSESGPTGTPRTPAVAAVRRLARALVALMVLSGVLMVAPAAHAEADRIDSLDIAYRVDRQGVLHVRETFVWRFGTDSGRHGIQRMLITREPDPDTGGDIVYTIEDFAVTSPDPSIPTTVTPITDGGPLSRTRSTTYRIGDPDIRVSDDTATYVISYRVRGAMRHSAGYDELYWDATGFDNPGIDQVSITAAVPGGAQDLRCYAGPVGSRTTCDDARRRTGQATFVHNDLPAADGITIGVKLAAGSVTDNAPHLQPRAGLGAVAGSRAVAVPGGIALLLAALIPIIALFGVRRFGRDQRYADLAPGSVPDDAAGARVERATAELEVPVRFSPPDAPAAQAGMLTAGSFEARHSAAALIASAVAGAIKIWTRYENQRGFTAELVDREKASSAEQKALLDELFPDDEPVGTAHRVSSRGAMAAAHTAAGKAARADGMWRGWYLMPPASGSGISGGLVAGLVIAGLLFVAAVVVTVLWLTGMVPTAFPVQLCFAALPLLALAVTAVLVRRRLRAGRRTARGRAICDQALGFQQYLATAEAEHLRFEEGHDIYSQYLPWAVAFDLAGRWHKICAALVEQGRLPDATPSWFASGSDEAIDFRAFNVATFASTMTGASEPLPRTGGGWFSGSSSTSGTGAGSSGSSFSSGGGFSGGGGGGGGSSSW
ncbi:DUF2207 domain-containing protein [Microlunatus soli]|uniref:Predicted membrane protein n=1 Tax=Microlunatus soli TaxID=630515 RepID=A0A1H1X8L5_9ACTN|nr:DUF2207 domain-containing protein [Microlunatus soli]SDT05647.1 Predicted membrane protein [Microlunatus soli]